ncbi:MAG: MBOAT family protein [Lachnospiraceae bacterium]|nr:MBOAT family protein [Lachnospiraceae bacterium]
MTYVSFFFYIFLLIVLFLYYAIPLRHRWVVLLIGSAAFYFIAYKSGWPILFITVLFAYGFGRLINYLREKYTDSHRKLQKAVLVLAYFCVVLPWLLIKNGNFILVTILHMSSINWIVPLGISFYTLQTISYLADIYRGEIDAQKNIAKYALFILFFPQIIQGPIPRYEQLAKQLYEGRLFDEKRFVKGLQLILWGFFLKLMIADKAAVIVNTVFDNPEKYMGCYVLIAAVLYSIELYTDFLACVTISQGVSGLFGIELVDNFRRPYFATSIKEFWRRWHISLSEWLRDYIYIPLGGSRKGRLAKYINLLITFIVSGIWHGAGYKFILWGLMHAIYQICGDLTADIRNKIYDLLKLSEQSGLRKTLQRIGVFFWVTIAWIIFRADSLRIGLKMIMNMFLVHNPWIFFNDKLLMLGLEWKELCVLAISIVILLLVSYKQEKGVRIRELILDKSIYTRWFIYIFAILCIMIFGTYGYGYNAQDFIYGGF